MSATESSVAPKPSSPGSRRARAPSSRSSAPAARTITAAGVKCSAVASMIVARPHSKLPRVTRLVNCPQRRRTAAFKLPPLPPRRSRAIPSPPHARIAPRPRGGLTDLDPDGRASAGRCGGGGVARDGRATGEHSIAPRPHVAGLADGHQDVGARAELYHAELLAGAERRPRLDPAPDPPCHQPGDLHDDDGAARPLDRQVLPRVALRAGQVHRRRVPAADPARPY